MGGYFVKLVVLLVCNKLVGRSLTNHCVSILDLLRSLALEIGLQRVRHLLLITANVKVHILNTEAFLDTHFLRGLLFVLDPGHCLRETCTLVIQVWDLTAYLRN